VSDQPDIASRHTAVWRLLDLPIDAIYDHGPGLTNRQYNALRRYFDTPWTAGYHAEPEIVGEPTMADLLGMSAAYVDAAGPRPDLDAEPRDVAAARTWNRYHYRDGFMDIRGIGIASASDIQVAVRLWFRDARAAVLAGTYAPASMPHTKSA
jgi:hypothetical protein